MIEMLMGPIVILCQSRQDVQYAFDVFVSYLDSIWPLDASVFVDEYAGIIDTYHGVRYIFSTEGTEDIYKIYADASDFIYADEFLEGIDPQDFVSL